MPIIKKIFGIKPSERDLVPNGLRGLGVEGGKGIFDEYFNQIMFETQADHIIDTEANVKLADDPRGTCYYDSTSTSFLDAGDATVTFEDGDRIVWKGLDTLTANIDISTIDNLEHIMWQGTTIALGTYDLDLGENQRGELNLSGSGTLTILSSDGLRVKASGGLVVDVQAGDAVINNASGYAADFRKDNLLINVYSTTQILATFKRISLPDNNFLEKYLNNKSILFANTNLMAGTSLKNNTWYRLWLDSDENKLIVPDIEGTADGTSSGFLVDSTSTLATDKVNAGAVVFNTTTLQKTTITVAPTVDGAGVSLADDIFVSGNTYKIYITEPTGLTSNKVNPGFGFINGAGQFDDCGYTKPWDQSLETYTGDGADWTLSSSPAIVTLNRADSSIYQSFGFGNTPIWYTDILADIAVASGSRSLLTATATGMIFYAGYDQAGSGYVNPAPLRNNVIVLKNTANFYNDHGTGTTQYYGFNLNRIRLNKKPPFATRS